MPPFPQYLLRSSSALILLIASARPLAAQSPITSQLVVSGLSDPIFVTAPAGDFGRLFVVERGQQPLASVRLVDISQNPPVLQPWPYVTVGDVGWISGEGGLLSMAFHPQFATNGYFYLFYTPIGSGVRIVRYQAAAPYATSTNADLGSATTVLTIPITGHKGGWMGFGPDGYLYAAIGDMGGPDAQNLTLLNGKILRIDVDGDDFPSDPNRNYAIPPGNPFAGSSTAAPEVLHYGLRNPYRASIDRLTGELWIADVGLWAVEEINHVPAGVVGLNFGWDCMEGPACTGSAACVCNDPALTLPTYSYPHTGGLGHCVIGGYRYRGSALCGFQDAYFFADWVAIGIWTFEWDGSSPHNLLNRSAELIPNHLPYHVYSFGEDAAGELYFVDMSVGKVYKIVPGTITDCNGNGIHDRCEVANGTTADWNGNGVPDECEPIGAPSCFGDGSTQTACPCANTGAPGRGCENSAFTGGAGLDGVGTAAGDDVALLSAGELPAALTVFLQGNLVNTNGAVFGDGVRCVAGALKRMYVKSASGGFAHAPGPGDPSIATRSAQLGDPLLPPSGQVRHYQAYYRDPSPSFCPAPAGATWNVSSLLAITW